MELPQHGKCQMFFRDYVGEVDSPIEFSKEPESIPLQFVIGEKSYRIDKITTHEDSLIEAVLQISGGMVHGSNEIYLKPVNKPGDNVKTGSYQIWPLRWLEP